MVNIKKVKTRIPSEKAYARAWNEMTVLQRIKILGSVPEYADWWIRWVSEKDWEHIRSKMDRYNVYFGMRHAGGW